MLNNPIDMRYQSYIIYQMKSIFKVRLLGLMYEIKSMQEMTRKLNTENITKIQ